jgi:hypothetical protein
MTGRILEQTALRLQARLQLDPRLLSKVDLSAWCADAVGRAPWEQFRVDGGSRRRGCGRLAHNRSTRVRKLSTAAATSAGTIVEAPRSRRPGWKWLASKNFAQRAMSATNNCCNWPTPDAPPGSAARRTAPPEGLPRPKSLNTPAEQSGSRQAAAAESTPARGDGSG